jgi:hypothetical protein
VWQHDRDDCSLFFSSQLFEIHNQYHLYCYAILDWGSLDPFVPIDDLFWRNLHPACLVLVLHTLTNDLKTKTPTTCIDEMDRICKTIHELYSNTKIILSLPTPRSDSQEYNNKGQLITAMIKDKFRANELITVCQMIL